MNDFNFSLLLSKSGSSFDKSLPRLSRIVIFPALVETLLKASPIAKSCLSGVVLDNLSADKPNAFNASTASPDLLSTASPILSPISLKISAIWSPDTPAFSAANCQARSSWVDTRRDLAQRSVSVIWSEVDFSKAMPAALAATAAPAAATPTDEIAEPAALASLSICLRHFPDERSAFSIPATKPPTLAIRSIVRVPRDLLAIFSPKKTPLSGAHLAILF